MKESSFRFSTPRLLKLDYVLSANYKKSESIHYQNNFSIAINRVADKKEAVVELTLVVGEENGSANVPYMVTAVIGAKFDWDVDYDEEMLGRLLSINAPALLLSYARPIIASITNASGRTAFDIPFIDFTASVAETKSIEKSQNTSE